MPVNLTSKTMSGLFAQFQTDGVTITRETPTGGADLAITQIYAGNAGIQEGGGKVYYTPSGAQEVSDAMLFLNTANLPAVQVGDIVTRNSDGKQWTVASTSIFPRFIPHLELSLHIGPLTWDQAVGG